MFNTGQGEWGKDRGSGGRTGGVGEGQGEWGKTQVFLLNSHGDAY